MQTVPAEIDENGTVTLLTPFPYSAKRRAIVIIFDVGEDVSETALMSESVLGKDWNHLQEDIAWSHLQLAQVPSAGRTNSG